MTSAMILVTIRRLLLATLFACQLIQYFIEDTLVNTTCVFMALVSSTVVIVYVFNVSRFRRAPLSLVMVLGFNVSALSGALIIQTANSTPIDFNLDVPLETFSALMFTQFVVIAVQYLYSHSRLMGGLRNSLRVRIFQPLGLMEAPSDAELWIFGIVGLLVTLFAAHGYTDAVQFGDASSKFVLGYTPFVVAPFFIPMRPYVLGGLARTKSSLPLIAVYTLALITVAMANNARATFSSGFLTLLLCGLIAVLSGNLVLTPRRIASGLIMMGLAVPVFLTLSDLATAMVIARDERSNVSSMELIEITLNNFQDKRLIEERRHRDSVISGAEYNESYISNAIFARFVYTKFVDVNMNNALRLTSGQAEEIRKGNRTRILAMLPTPVLNFFSINVDKTDLGFSSGDLYSYIARGIELGSYTTGSEIPDGITIFGMLFWPVLSLMVLIQFIIYDAFAKVAQNGRVQVSALILLNVVPIFTLGVMQESVSNQVISIVRGVPQLMLLYWVLRLCTTLALRPWASLRRLGAKTMAAHSAAMVRGKEVAWRR